MKNLLLLSLSLLLLSLSGCSKVIVNKMSDALSTSDGGSVFTSDNDPELMRDAFPLALKM